MFWSCDAPLTNNQPIRTLRDRKMTLCSLGNAGGALLLEVRNYPAPLVLGSDAYCAKTGGERVLWPRVSHAVEIYQLILYRVRYFH